jgi:hypothetical protein
MISEPPNSPTNIDSSIINHIQKYINDGNYFIPIPIKRPLSINNVTYSPNPPTIHKSSIRNRIGDHIKNSNYSNSLPIHIQYSPQLSPITAFERELELQKQNNPQNNKSALFIRVNDGKNIRNLTHRIFDSHHLTDKAKTRRKKREDRGYQSQTLGGRRTKRRKRKN